MDDSKIIDLFWARSEAAIAETAQKYGRYCYSISYNILRSKEDSEECVNETYLGAWKAMPPKRPERLSVFLGKIARNVSLNRFKQYSALKRGLGQIELALSELEDCIPAPDNASQVMDEMALTESLSRFLSGLQATKRKVFVQRYWYLRAIKEISEQFGMSESKITSMLFKLRKELKAYLEKEGVLV